MVGARKTMEGGSQFAHALNAIHIGDSYDSIDDYLIYQYSEIDIKWGSWQMPTDCVIHLKIPTSISIAGYNYSGFFKTFRQ